MNGREKMEQDQKDMVELIEMGSENILSTLEFKGVIPKQTGWMGMNIFIVDFKSENDYNKAHYIADTQQNKVGYYKTTKYDKPKRIAFYF